MEPAQLRCKHLDTEGMFAVVSMHSESEVMQIQVQMCDVCVAEMVRAFDRCLPMHTPLAFVFVGRFQEFSAEFLKNVDGAK